MSKVTFVSVKELKLKVPSTFYSCDILLAFPLHIVVRKNGSAHSLMLINSIEKNGSAHSLRPINSIEKNGSAHSLKLINTTVETAKSVWVG